MIYAVEMASCGMILPSFMKIRSGVQAILFCLRNLKGCNVGIAEGRDFSNYAVEVGSGAMIYVVSFMKIGSGVQAILRFCLRNVGGCNIGITDRRNL
jgi:uncharacterized protein YraI